jgi:DNA-binding Xre family transcriptional regulator
MDCYYLHISVLLPANGDGAETLDIPGLTIRALTDPEFSAHLARAAAEQARHVGKRLRELRIARGLSAKSVAQRAGLAPQSLSRIELGQHDVVFTTLQKILGAMGCSLSDLAASEPTQPVA